MAFHVTHRYGAMTSNPPSSTFASLLRELDERPEDQEHCSVSVTHESEWCLGAHGGGHVVWENLEGGDPRHMVHVPDAEILRLWQLLAAGDIAAIEREPWLPGY
jgi:hypothetical protein